jgi:photosynthetic reaction center cytochrome c subunit
VKLGVRRTALLSAVTIGIFFFAGVLAFGQAAAPRSAQPPRAQSPAPAQSQTPAQSLAAGQKAEDVFKNVKVLKGISVKEFMDTMGFFAASTGLNCADCHVSEKDWDAYAKDDRPQKLTARRMVVMVNGINRSYFGGRRVLTCWSCHRGGDKPTVTPDLTVQYSSTPPPEPDEITEAAPRQPSADEILDKYIQAIGGAQRVAGLTSFTAKGTYVGFDTAMMKVPVDIYAKAPNQRTTIVHMPEGDSTRTYDGQRSWFTLPGYPVPVLELSGGDLNGAKADALLAFPARIKQDFSQWIVGFPVTINDVDTLVVQGRVAPGGFPVKLYFDPKTGLLVRSVRLVNSIVGMNPTQVDYEDYREVNGVKLPFKWTVTWTDGRSVTELSSLQTNVPVDAAKFGKPRLR